MNQPVERSASAYLGVIEIAYQCLALIEGGADIKRVGRIVWSTYAMTGSTFPEFHNVLFDIQEYSDFTSSPEALAERQKVYAEARAELAALHGPDIINPDVTDADKSHLETLSMPILTKMVETPDDSPKLLVDLVFALDEQVKAGAISPIVAGWEVSHTLDRPQIMASRALRDALQKADELERPLDFRRRDPLAQWRSFAAAVIMSGTTH